MSNDKIKTKIVIRDIPEDKRKGLLIRTPNGIIGYYFSSFNCGIFLNDVPGDGTDRGRLYPQLGPKQEEIDGWEVLDNTNGNDYKTNCNERILLKDIMNNMGTIFPMDK